MLGAKGFPWISPVGHILVLVPRFDREFVTTFQGHGSVGGKNGTRSVMNFVFNEGLCVSINEFLRKSAAQEGPHIILLAIWRGR